MSSYTEDHLVEQPAVRLCTEIGWTAVSALDETLGLTGTLGREIKSEVVLIPKLRPVLERLNPALAPDAINSAVDACMRSLGDEPCGGEP